MLKTYVAAALLIVCFTLCVGPVKSAPPVPYPVMGRVIDTAGNIVPSAKVTIANLATSEVLGPFAIRPDGIYLLDLSSFQRGWSEGNVIRVSARAFEFGRSLSGEYTFVASSGEWMAGGHQQDIIMNVKLRGTDQQFPEQVQTQK